MAMRPLLDWPEADRRQIIGIVVRRPHMLAVIIGLPPCLDFLNHIAGCGNILLFQRGKAGSRANQHHGPAIGKNIGCLCSFEQRIDRHMNQSRARRFSGGHDGRTVAKNTGEFS